MALVEVSCFHGRQLLYLHGVGNCSSARVGGGAHAPSSRRMLWPTHQSKPGGGRARQRLLVRGGELSCGAETCRARKRLVVWGGDLSCGAETSRARQRLVVGNPLVGNLSEMQPTGRKLEVLPVWVLTGVLSPPHLESWP
jgi:hypothetical protein